MLVFFSRVLSQCVRSSDLGRPPRLVQEEEHPPTFFSFSQASPGPRYDIRGKHWKDVTTRTKKNNAAKFGKGERFEKRKLGDIDVGPGQYDRKDTAVKLGRRWTTGRSVGRSDKIINSAAISERVLGVVFRSLMSQVDDGKMIP